LRQALTSVRTVNGAHTVAPVTTLFQSDAVSAEHGILKISTENQVQLLFTLEDFIETQ